MKLNINPFIEILNTNHLFINNNDFLLVSGENGTGKSFFAKLLSYYFIQNNIKCFRVGMELRNIERIFGNEAWHSTGVISINSILAVMETSRLLDEEHVIIFDEPDIGLSEKYQNGVGEKIYQFLRNKPEKLIFSSIITHSKCIIRKVGRLNPSYLRIGDKKTLTEVLKPEDEVGNLEDLQLMAEAKYREILRS